jgi:hypothetical protein
MKSIQFDNVEYSFDPVASYKDHTFVSIKKATKFKDGNVKFQNLTIRNSDWPKFREFLLEILCEA